MKRTLQVTACLLLIGMMVFPVNCYDSTEMIGEITEMIGEIVDTKDLEQAAPDSLQGEVSTRQEKIGEWFLRVKEELDASFAEIVKKATGSGVKLLLILLVCALADGLGEVSGGMSQQAVRLAGVAGASMVALGDVKHLIGLGRETIENLSDFTVMLMPTLTAVSVAGGAPSGAPVRQGITLLCSNLLLQLIDRVLLPLTWAYAAGSIVNAALDGNRMESLCKLMRWSVKSILTAALVLYSGYLTFAGAAAHAADTAAMKAARMAISGMIPVVGGLLSDATEAALSGASVLRNSIGFFGVAGVLGFCLVPLVRLGIQFLTYRLVAAFSDMVTDHPVSKLIHDLSGVFSLVMAMTGACAVVVLFSLVQVIGVVVT